MKKLYIGKLVLFDGPWGPEYRLSSHQAIIDLGGSWEIFASWDNAVLNPNGNPRALNKNWNVVAIINLPTEAAFSQLPAAELYSLQALLVRENPTYTNVDVPFAAFPSIESAKAVAYAQLQTTHNAIFTSPERNQLKQEFPLIETASVDLFDTFTTILVQDAHLSDYTIPDDVSRVQVSAIERNVTLTLPLNPLGELQIDRLDNTNNTVTLNPSTNIITPNTIGNRTTARLTLSDGVWSWQQ